MPESFSHARPAPPPVIFRAALEPDASVEQFFMQWQATSGRQADDDAERADRLTALIHADTARLLPECLEAMRAYPLACMRLAETLAAEPVRAIRFFEKISIDDAAAVIREIDAQDPVLAARLLHIVNESTPAQAMGLYNTLTQALRGGLSNYHSRHIDSGYNSIDGIALSQPERPLTYKFLL